MADWASIRSGRVLYEDDAALVLDKPAGISVVGERHETDVVRLAKEAGEQLFPAHRIDKVTSGAVLFARQLDRHGDLTRQFNRRTVSKAYLAVANGTGLPERGVIDLPLSAGRKNRVRIAAERGAIVHDGQRWSVPDADVFTQVRVYPSVTSFATVQADDERTLLVVRPLTGRRHQIRVHLAWIGHELAGDPLFDKRNTGRTLLHSWRLGFDAAWRDNERITVTAAPGEDFWAPLDIRVPEDQLTAAADRLAAEPAPEPNDMAADALSEE